MKIPFPQSHKTEIAIGGRVLDCFATPLREAEQVISISHWGMYRLDTPEHIAAQAEINRLRLIMVQNLASTAKRPLPDDGRNWVD